MQVTINKSAQDLPERATVADAIAQVRASPPFAVAVNMQFVPKSRYAQTLLAPQDSIEIIRPVTGG